MTRPLIADLYCAEGGAAWGYWLAGFQPVGVDIVPQPRYPFPMVVADALTPPFDLSRFAAVHASPPCQAHTALRTVHRYTDYAERHPDLVAATRDLLRSSGRPWVMENVPGAPMTPTVILCGSSFGLRVRRHRLFESNVALLGLPCRHREQGQPLGVYGTGGGGQMTRGRKATPAEARDAMGMPWASRRGTSQAIPPAYTEHLGRQLLAAIKVAA